MNRKSQRVETAPGHEDTFAGPEIDQFDTIDVCIALIEEMGATGALRVMEKIFEATGDSNPKDSAYWMVDHCEEFVYDYNKKGKRHHRSQQDQHDLLTGPYVDKFDVAEVAFAVLEHIENPTQAEAVLVALHESAGEPEPSKATDWIIEQIDLATQ
jgi:hypothetical protein